MANWVIKLDHKEADFKETTHLKQFAIQGKVCNTKLLVSAKNVLQTPLIALVKDKPSAPPKIELVNLNENISSMEISPCIKVPLLILLSAFNQDQSDAPQTRTQSISNRRVNIISDLTHTQSWLQHIIETGKQSGTF